MLSNSSVHGKDTSHGAGHTDRGQCGHCEQGGKRHQGYRERHMGQGGEMQRTKDEYWHLGGAQKNVGATMKN